MMCGTRYFFVESIFSGSEKCLNVVHPPLLKNDVRSVAFFINVYKRVNKECYFDTLSMMIKVKYLPL